MSHRKVWFRLPLVMAALAAGAHPARAQEQADSARIAELERRVEILAEELEQLRAADTERMSVDEARILGLAPSAAAAYARSGASFAAYGEMLYENYSDLNSGGDPTDKTSEIDYLRAVFYAGYRFSDRFLFNSEIEVEHANEIFVEMAYVDWRATDRLGFRAGMMLMPVGLVNELHEPTVFLGSERPVTERAIIPSTWRANGGGFYGSAGPLSYRAYLVNSLKGAGFSASGLRGGRQKGIKAKASDMAVVGRVDLTPTPGVYVGASAYRGGTDHGEIELAGSQVESTVTILEGHAHAQFRGLTLRALYARATVGNAGRLNRALGMEGSNGVGSGLNGWYAQAGYDLLSQRLTDWALTPYVRYEKVDTQASMPTGFERRESTKNSYLTLGFEVRPLAGILLKVDHAWVANDADTGVNQFNVNVGFAF